MSSKLQSCAGKKRVTFLKMKQMLTQGWLWLRPLLSYSVLDTVDYDALMWWPRLPNLSRLPVRAVVAKFSRVSRACAAQNAWCLPNSRWRRRSVLAWVSAAFGNAKNSRATPTPPRSCKFSAQKFANSLQIFCVCEFMAIGLTWAFWFITFSVYFFGRWIIFGEDLMYFMSLFEKRKENWPTSTQKLINFKAHKMRSPGFTEYAFFY